ncbi:MAG: putative glycoside hydrolase [Desulfobaccales bacterium]
MQKHLRWFVLFLVGSLVLAMPAVASDAKVVNSQTKQPVATAAPAYDGKVIDAQTKAPIEGALVTLGDRVVRTDQNGAFHLEGTGEALKLRAPGYARRRLAMAELGNPASEIALTPFKVKALYLTVYGIASKKLREAALETMKANHLNALVIDIKGDRGFIPFKVNIPLAEEVGAQKTILIKDMPALMASLKEQGLYLIARIVVFKDDPLAAAKPQWAVKRGGGVFRDRERLRWVDPFRREVWDYNIAIAKVAAELGFDEVQFDYVRCPDKRGVVFSQPSNQDTRTEAVTGFLKAAHQALAPYNVMVAADVFGYVLWNLNDTGIGQKIAEAVKAVDVVGPMLYPSGFQFGIPDYRNPVQHPYEIVYLSLKRAQARTGASPLRFRPWLQAFRDYAFHGGDFTEERMRIQIEAADKFGASGWMFWNPRNIYPTGKFTNDGGGQESASLEK